MGRALHAFGEEITLLLDGQRTGGKLTTWTEVTPPGGGPRVAFLSGGEWHEVDPGGYAFMPRGLVHTFKNVGDQPSRMLITTTPSGMEKFFARCAEEFAKPSKPDMSAIVQIGIEHGIHFVL